MLDDITEAASPELAASPRSREAAPPLARRPSADGRLPGRRGAGPAPLSGGPARQPLPDAPGAEAAPPRPAGAAAIIARHRPADVRRGAEPEGPVRTGPTSARPGGASMRRILPVCALALVLSCQSVPDQR